MNKYWMVSIALFAGLGISPWGTPANSSADQTLPFVLQLRDGSIVRVNAGEEEFQWKTVGTDGSVSTMTLSVSDIAALKFTESPASDEVARIRALVNDLASDDYLRRHAAEKQLHEQGKPFATVIEQARNHREPEVRYRVARILKFLQKVPENNATRFALDFDILELKDGRRLEGDIGDWSLKGQWNNEPVEMNREQCSMIRNHLPFESVGQERETTAVATQSVTDQLVFFDEEAVKDEFVHVTFDVGARGERTVNDREFDVGELFSFLGCKVNCETNGGRVVVSGFKFKQGRSRNRSIGNFYIDPERNKKVSYQGTMRIDFCMPGNPSVPAAVDSAGLFVEIVIPEHTIVEAYNSAGHIIGLTQSAHDRTSFIGFTGNSGIAWLRVHANEYLVVEKLNKDFALDDLVFSKPAAAPEINFVNEGESGFVIVTSDNQRLLARSVRFNGNQLDVVSSAAGIEDFSLDVDKVRWVVGPQSRDQAPSIDDGVFVMLSDGSVVHCQLGENLVATHNKALQIESDDVIGLWGAQSVCRYPQPEDFDHGQIVMVRPLNRVALTTATLDFGNGRLNYELDGAKSIEQNVASDDSLALVTDAGLSHLGVEVDAPASDVIRFEEATGTLWKQAPQTRAAGTGLLRTNDGQQFVIGGSSGFELVSTEGDSITLKRGDQEFAVELEMVAALNLPE